MLDLIRSMGDLPTADQVAEQAGLSRRTVFRLFEDLEKLHLAAIAAQRAEVIELFPPPMSASSLSEAIDALVDHRAALYEHVAPIRRVAQRLTRSSEIVKREQTQTRAQLRMHLNLLVGAYLPAERREREETLDAVQVTTSWATWEVLREDHGHDIAHAKRVIKRMLRPLFD